ncbi:MAG: S16 family serine protease [Acidimicrobiales bacterium]
MTADPPHSDPAPLSPRRRRRWPTVVALVVGVVVLAALITSRIQLNEYALTPGEAESVGPLISLPSGKGHPLHGRVLLTDVNLTQLTALDYLFYRLNGDAALVSGDQLVEPGTSSNQLILQGFLEMQQAKIAAQAAAFRRLGERVTERAGGTLVYGVQEASPAAGHLAVGDIVTAVDGRPTPGVCQFIGALHRLAPGSAARLDVRPVSISGAGAVTYRRTATRVVRLGRRPKGEPAATGCPGVGASDAYLGVSIETNLVFGFPFPVRIDTADIGGPSAGLAMTLGLLDRLGGGDLTGGQTVAATGTIDPQGAVGDVGGVAQKTVAVERAGATVFLVPPEEYRAAESKDVPSLRIYPVATLAQALQVLERLGGRVPPPAAGTSARSTTTAARR